MNTPVADDKGIVTIYGVTISVTVWTRIKNGVPANYSEEEFRAYSAIMAACEKQLKAMPTN